MWLDARVRLLLLLGGAAAALSAAFGLAAWSEAAQRSADGTTLEEYVAVRRIHWPVLLEPRSGGTEAQSACSAVPPSTVEITEDGLRIPVIQIERSPLPVLHAIVLDTSSSMAGRLDEAKRAALRYVDSLGPGERALFAQFSDNLILGAPPTSDKESLRRAISRAELGCETALWDALHELLLYLDAWPTLKVVVLLTDGEDSASREEHDPEAIVETAAAASNLTVFTVGLDLPPAADAGTLFARNLVERLARDTGGEFLEVHRPEDIGAAFEEIRQHFQRRYYATYAPPPFGEGMKDEPRTRSQRWREVKVTAARGTPCAVRNAGPTRRLESVSRHARDTLEPLPFLAGEAERASAVVAEISGLVPARVPTRKFGFRMFELPGAPGAREARLILFDKPRALIGRLKDLVRERGALYPRDAAGGGRRPRLRLNGQPEFALREVGLEIPAVATLIEAPRSVEDVLAVLAERALRVPGTRAGRGFPENPALVQGASFLEMRKALALALFREVEDYRAWGKRRLVADRVPFVEQILEEFLSTRLATDDDLPSLRAGLLARAAEPDEDQPQRFLAEWLGDFTARDAVAAYERKSIGALLGLPPQSERTGTGEGEVSERAWRCFLEWFPVPDRVRVLVPLVPAYDPVRDAIGFYRIVLPRPAPGSTPRDVLPSDPLGLRTVRWLSERPSGRDTLRAARRVDAIDYGEPSWSERLAIRVNARGLGAPWSSARRVDRKVTLHLASDDDGRHEVRVTAYFAPPSAESSSIDLADPVAVRFCVDPGDETAFAGAVRRLAEVCPRVLPCPGDG